MAKIEIDVKRDTCLGHTVFRGSIKARELAPTLWIDFHDEELNPYGYQRPFNIQRSKQAADYALNTEDAFWPESILAIRDNSETDEDRDKVYWEFKPQKSSDSDFGKLIVEYNENRTELIGEQEVNWRRAFSQVDCQHRLGHMAECDKYVTVCIVPDIKRPEEAIIFKTINDKQRKISTSLVDAIIIITSKSPVEEPEVHWAYNLGIDSGSSFFKLVSSEGRNLRGQRYVVTLRTLKTSVASLVNGKRFIRNNITSQAEYDLAYLLIRSYWNAIKSLWPTEFNDNERFKLMTVPGLKGLSRFGRGIFAKAWEEQNTSERFVRKFFQKGPKLINWRTSGPFRDATGNAGARVVYEKLIWRYGNPWE